MLGGDALRILWKIIYGSFHGFVEVLEDSWDALGILGRFFGGFFGGFQRFFGGFLEDCSESLSTILRGFFKDSSEIFGLTKQLQGCQGCQGFFQGLSEN